MNKFILDVGAIRHNILFIRSKLKSGTKFCAMVKANAYGHGIVEISKASERFGADALGVATVEEGIKIRNIGII